jgi:asparaginyl-tRNA synthetase
MMDNRSMILQCFRDHFYDKEFTEVTPPTIVQTQVEGGSTLFKLDYFGEQAFLTQSSQLYLETAIPSLGKVFCVMPSFRAEKSRTRRHLSEFTHFEGEVAFMSYEDLLNLLEDMVCDVSRRVIERAGPMLKHFNADFVRFPPPHEQCSYLPGVPYVRMMYDELYRKCPNDHSSEWIIKMPLNIVKSIRSIVI